MLPLHLALPQSTVERVALGTYLLSTPFTAFVVFFLHDDSRRDVWALANSYLFSSSYCILYLWPLLAPGLSTTTIEQRLERATANWVVWLSCFTELVFQIPHNLFVSQIAKVQGTVLEWPFYAYGLSDVRWCTYSHEFWARLRSSDDGSTASSSSSTSKLVAQLLTTGSWTPPVTPTPWFFSSSSSSSSSRHDGDDRGLPPEVWLINWNDGLLGVVVALLLVQQARRPNSPSWRLLFVLALLLRDGTLFRETVEYLFLQHHMAGYPHSTADPQLRPHAIVCLWLVNGLWLVAPLLSFAWAFCRLSEPATGGDRRPVRVGPPAPRAGGAK